MTVSKQIKKFYLFGDSICYGQLVSSHKTWTNSLAEALEEYAGDNTSYIVQNAGINGNTTRQALERLYYDVTSHMPDYVLIQFGMNDCNYWESDRGLPRVSHDGFIANIKEIIEKCFASGVTHCFVNTNHPSLKGKLSHINKSYDESNREYSELLGNFFKKNKNEKVTLIDIRTIWDKYLYKNSNLKLSNFLLDDGIHLSEAGHELYKKTVVKTIISKITAK